MILDRELLSLAGQHLVLVVASTAIAVGIGIPTGVALTRRPSLQRPVLGLANVLQTIPSLALFGFLLPIPLVGGIGARTAIVALVLYSLLPIIRNTVAGIESVDAPLREAAVAMGMTPRQVLFEVELPLALGVILTGVRVATVIAVGVATIAAAIGAGGLGTFIFRGLRMNDDRLILEGAVPAALMALGLDFALGLLAARASRRAEGEPRPRRRLAFAWRALVVLVPAALVLSLLVRARTEREGSTAAAGTAGSVTLCSKDFTEQVLLGEILAQSLEARGVTVARRFELGGNLCHEALVAGRVDGYPEYTGTAFTSILHHPRETDARAVYETVRREYRERFSVEVSAGLGFANDFAILVRGDDARRLHLRTISDAAPFAPGWIAGFGQDFMSRPDGYAGFARAYSLRFQEPPREMDLSLTYRALAEHRVDLIAGNSTDGLIGALDLAQLEDDRRYFPPYEAVALFREDAIARVPAIREVMAELAGAITTADMRRMNLAVDGDKRPPAEVARTFLAERRRRTTERQGP